jgi:hypothetical protein
VRIVFICILSSIAATAASVAALLLSYSFILDQRVSGEDLTGIAIFSFLPSLLMSGLVYTPGLHLLWKKRRECGPAKLFVTACAVVLNIPAFAVLGYSAATGGFFGEGEAWYFVLGFVVAGIVYGLGFQWQCRKRHGQGA